MHLTIRRVTSDRIIDLRHQMLRAGLPRETAIFPGDEDETSVHFAAFEKDALIGCVTLHLNEWEAERAYQLRGMAVTSEYQGHGVGRELLDTVNAFVRSPASPTRLLWCNARTPAEPFYGRHGWQTVSAPFDIPTAGPHVKMIRRV